MVTRDNLTQPIFLHLQYEADFFGSFNVSVQRIFVACLQSQFILFTYLIANLSCAIPPRRSNPHGGLVLVPHRHDLLVQGRVELEAVSIGKDDALKGLRV